MNSLEKMDGLNATQPSSSSLWFSELRCMTGSSATSDVCVDAFFLWMRFVCLLPTSMLSTKSYSLTAMPASPFDKPWTLLKSTCLKYLLIFKKQARLILDGFKMIVILCSCNRGWIQLSDGHNKRIKRCQKIHFTFVCCHRIIHTDVHQNVSVQWMWLVIR